LEQQNYFGFPKEDVVLFEQGLLPCFDLDGKIILESAGSVAMAPDGNGGFFDALERQHVLPDMRRRGIRHLHVYGIDNMLTRSADPVFIGYCIHENAEAGNKVVWRAGPDERVGVIAKRAGRTQVVEYSELPTEMAALRDADGKLVFGAANIANHYFSEDFLEHTALPNLQLVYHIAKKKIAHVSEDGLSTVTPDDVNGYKLEMFIFDVFPLAERMATLEVSREEEFAPVKNANGTSVDSPDTARVLVSNLCKRWLREAGAELVGYDSDELCEVKWGCVAKPLRRVVF
jgi:UDP-N-acetylglucosamine/UDP-N-acetylgalactosamine diphosphorylase